MVLMLIASACGQEAKKDDSSGKTKTAANEKPDPFGKYNPEITVETVHQSGDETVKFKNGDTFQNNVYTRAYKNELGINIKYRWVAIGDDEEQKYKLMVTSGDLPDIIYLNFISL